MSNKTNPVAPVPNPEPAKTESKEKTNLFAKTKQFVVKHKTPAIAVGALVSLVGIAAVAGKKTDPLPDFDETHAPLPEQDVDDEVETDTTVA